MKLFLLGLLITLFICLNVQGQKKTRLIKVTEDNIPVLVLQQDCPVKIEKAEFFLTESGSGNIIGYEIRNVSSKTIKSVEITAYSAVGGGSGWSLRFEDSNLFTNNQSIKSLTNTEYEVISSSKKPKNFLLNETRIKTYWIVLVEEVIFSDGTKFNAKNLSNSLQEFLVSSDK